MSSDSDPSKQATDKESADDRVEALLFECLEAQEPTRAIEAAAGANPELAQALRRAYGEMVRFDLLGPTSTTARQVLAGTADSMPQQLGDYRLLDRLGAGGMGVVFLARDDILQRTVALKLIRPEHLYMPGARERFQREVETIARLQHPGIVPIYGVGKSEGMPYFTMQHINGCSLATALTELHVAIAAPDGRALLQLAAKKAQASPSTEPRSGSGSTHGLDTMGWADTCVSLAVQVAAALHHAHERGVLHRDVKPSNILLTAEGRAMLVDFGLAWSDDADQRLTQSTSQLGSLPYLPPEHVDGRAIDPSRAADVYSLGVTLYEMLTLKNPFLGKNGEETQRNILGARTLRLRREQRGVSWELETVCMKALDPDPSKRYGTMLEFQRDLEHVLNRETIDARRPGWLRRTRRWGQRHPSILAALTVALLSSIGALLIFSMQERQARVQSDALRETAEVERYGALVSHADIELHTSNRPARARQQLAQCREQDRGWEWSHLEFATDQSATTDTNIGGVVQDLLWCPDGKSYLVATQSKELICHALDQRELWRQKNLATSAITFRPTGDGFELICGRLNAEIWSHDLATGNAIAAFDTSGSGLVGELTSLAASPDGRFLYSTCADGNVSLWDAQARNFVQHLGKHNAQAHSLAISADGLRIATGGFDKTVRVFDTVARQEVCQWPTYHWAFDVAFAKDSRHLVLTDGKNLRVADTQQPGAAPTVVDAKHQTVLAVACSPDGQFVAAAVERRILHIYRVAPDAPFRLRRIARLVGHEGLLQHIRFSPDSANILTAGTDESVRMWSPQHCAELQSHPHQRMVTSVAFGPDDALISADSSGNICRSNPDGSWQFLATTAGQPAHAASVVALLPQRWLQRTIGITSIDQDGRIIEWHSKDGEWHGSISETTLQVAAATMHQQHPHIGSLLESPSPVPILATTDGKLHVLHQSDWQAHEQRITQVLSDGQHVWSACVAGQLKCWDIATGQLRLEAEQHPDWIAALAIAPDGSWIATSCADTIIRLIDTKTGKVRQQLEGHGRVPLAMTTDASGSRLISSGGFDSELRFWLPSNGSCVLNMSRPESIMAMALNPNTGALALGARLGQLELLRIRQNGPRAFSTRPTPHDTLTSPPGGPKRR